MSYKSNKSKYLRSLLTIVKQRMDLVAVMVEGYIKASMNISNIHGTNPSVKGEVPHVGTAALRNSITHKVATSSANKEIAAYVGAFNGPGAKYARRLELGFYGLDSRGYNYRQAERPFLWPGVQNNREKIIRIIRGG